MEFCWSSRTKGIIGRSQIRRICSSLQNLDWKYFSPHFEKKDGCHGGFFLVMTSAYISLIIIAFLCMGENQAPLALHFVFLITL